MKNLTKISVVVSTALLLAGIAHAIPISGTVGMFGYGFSDFDPMTATAVPDPSGAYVTSATVDFDTYFNIGDSVNYNGFTFNPVSSPVADPLWFGGGFSFVLNSVSIDIRTDHQLTLSGLGILSGNGFDSTYGSWGITIWDIGNLQFNFSNTTSTTAAPVPEPSTVLLLGVGLLTTIGLCRKKLRKG